MYVYVVHHSKTTKYLQTIYMNVCFVFGWVHKKKDPNCEKQVDTTAQRGPFFQQTTRNKKKTIPEIKK